VDRWVWWTTTWCVGLLARVAGTVSYLHMHLLVELHGQPGWVAALTPLSVDGMIVAASTTLLADSGAGERGGLLPWALLIVGSVASLVANVAVAEPSAAGRVIAAWPPFALIGAYELLMRQVRRSATSGATLRRPQPPRHRARRQAAGETAKQTQYRAPGPDAGKGQPGRAAAGRDLQQQAWQWALAHRASDGSLPSGRDIGRRYGRHERWGRLVKRAGAQASSRHRPACG
jgi:Protein of unknown function (DUF2637)